MPTKRKAGNQPRSTGSAGKGQGDAETKSRELCAQSAVKSAKEVPDDAVETDDYKKRLEKYEKELEMEKIAPVDDECPRCLDHHVYWEGEEIFEVMLKKPNIDNKDETEFCLLQLVEGSCSNNFAVWMRWGIVGQKSQTCWTACGQDVLKAINVFKIKFSEKTLNKWEERDKFKKHAGKFIVVEMDRSIVKGAPDKA